MSTPDAPRRTPEQRYENALKWIFTIAGLHWFGGAFDPEHMRDLANVAANALNLSSKDLPDFEGRMAESQDRAREMAAAFGAELAGEDDMEDPGDHH